MIKNILTTATMLLVVQTMMASGPLRRTINLQKSYGTTIEVKKCGNAQFSWWEAADGTRYVRQGNDKTLIPLSEEDWTTSSQQLRPHRAMNASTENGMGKYGQSGNGIVNSIGAPVIPVIMVAYSDLDFLEADTQEKVSRFLNEKGYNEEQLSNSSVADYFRYNSFGAFSPTFDVVAKVTMPYDHHYYGDHSGSANDANVKELVREAVKLAMEQGVDFSKYATDGKSPIVSIIHAGPGEQEDFGKDCDDYVWAHYTEYTINAGNTTFSSYIICNETLRDFDAESTVTNEVMTGIGTFCHEFGHALGLPDMYDVDGSSNGTAKTPGYWDVMDYQFMYNGYRPMGYSAYERSMLGWLDVKELTEYGNYSLQAMNTNETLDDFVADGPLAYRLVNPLNDKECFILESRKSGKFYAENYLGKGMLIWHVNYNSSSWNSNRVNNDASNMRVRVIPADGEWQENKVINSKDENGKRYTFTGDVFPGYADVTQFDNTIANFTDGGFSDLLHSIAVDDNGTVSFTFTNLTGIQETKTIAGSQMAYDLQGRRLCSGNTAKGLYILNGKKIFVK